MGLFIALPLPKPLLRSLYIYEEKLKALSAAGSFVEKGNHHITLRYLGETDKLHEIATAMHQAARDAQPLSLKLGEYAAFTHRGSITGYLKVEGETEGLQRLHQSLENALWEQGLNRGRGKLVPHITLARGIETGDTSSLKSPGNSFVLRSMVLYESSSVKGKRVYTPVHKEDF